MKFSVTTYDAHGESQYWSNIDDYSFLATEDGSEVDEDSVPNEGETVLYIVPKNLVAVLVEGVEEPEEVVADAAD